MKTSTEASPIVTSKPHLPMSPAGPHFSGPYDRIIIADSFEERADLAQKAIRGAAGKVDVRILQDPTGAQATIEEIRDALSRRESVAVIMNIVGITTGFLKHLMQVEQEMGIGTRRALLTCFTKQQVQTACNEHGIHRPGAFMHVKYGDDNRIVTERLQQHFH